MQLSARNSMLTANLNTEDKRMRINRLSQMSTDSSISQRTDDPNGKNLRKYLHRDIFTTYISDPKNPQDFTIRESYLLERDNAKWRTHQPNVLSISELSTTEDYSQENHELGYALRRISGPRPGSSADTESTLSSDGGGSYSPPSSVSSWSPKEVATSDEVFASNRWCQENLPRIVKHAPRYRVSQGKLGKQSEPHSGDVLKSNNKPTAISSSSGADFEFLQMPIPPTSRIIGQNKEPTEETVAEFMEKLHRTQPKKKPSFEYRQYTGHHARTNSESSTTTEVQEKNGICAGIPPKVPPHRIFSSPARSPSNKGGKWSLNELPDKKSTDGSNDVYTRKCSQIQRRTTIIKERNQPEDQVLLVPRQRDEKRNVDASDSASSNETVKDKDTLISQSSSSSLSSLKFALPGYEDNNTTLKVVNHSGSRTASSTTINSEPDKDPSSVGADEEPIQQRRIRFQEPEVKEFDDFASEDDETEKIRISNKLQTRRRSYSGSSASTPRTRRVTSIYDAAEMADPYQQYFFGLEIADTKIMDEIWAKRGEGFLQAINRNN